MSNSKETPDSRSDPPSAGFSSAPMPSGATGVGASPPPPEIPDYALVHRLGRGGFGEIWLARSLAGDYRAIKVLPKCQRTDLEMEGIRLYQSRARRHPNLIEIVHIGQTDTHYYYVLDLADSLVTIPVFSYDAYEPRTLRRDLDRRGRLAPDVALPIARAVLSGLQYLHAQGLLHRDVKPDNIIFINGEPKLSDVGLVTRAADVGDPGLTPQYAPRGGVADPSGDLFSVGRVLAEMLLGWLPADPAPFRPPRTMGRDGRLAASLAVASRAAHPDPRRRTASAERMIAEIDAVLERGGGRRWGNAALVAAGVVVAALGLAAGIGPARALFSSIGARAARSPEPRITTAAGSASIERAAVPFRSPHALRFRRERRSFARAPVNDVFNLTGGFTIEFWYAAFNASEGAVVIGRRNDASWGPEWEVRQRLYTFAAAFSNVEAQSPHCVFYDGVARHFAVSWEPGTGNTRFYRNGEVVGAAQGPPATLAWGLMVSIGGLEGGDATLDGAIDEVRVWNRVLAVDEVFARFDRPLTAEESRLADLAAYWPFDEGSGQEAADATGRGSVAILGASPVPDAFDPEWTGSIDQIEEGGVIADSTEAVPLAGSSS